MRILYYTHIYFLDCDLPLIKALRNLGHEVYLVFELVSYHLKSTLVDIKKQQSISGILPVYAYSELDIISDYIEYDKSFILNRPGKVYGLQNLKLRYQFMKFVKNVNPDVIHCTDFIDVVDRFLYQYSKKIVQIVHDPFPHTGENTKRILVNRKYAYKRLERFVLLNENQKNKFINSNGLLPTKVHLNKLGYYDCIHLFKNTNTFIKSENKEIILFWGRISPYKGIEYLLKAIEIVYSTHPEINLIIAGSGDLYFDYTPYKELSYIKLINRHISMEELYSLLSIASLTVCPYIDATQSGVIMTSLAMNVPVVASNVGGIKETIKENVNGYLVPPKEPGHLAIAIEKALDNKSHLISNIKNMRNNDEKISWEGIAKQYIKIYSL